MKLDRRDFLKFGGLLSGTLSLFGFAGAGFLAGKSPTSYTGWGKNNLGKDQFFNRKPFYTNVSVHEKVGDSRRINYIENLFKRNGELFRLMKAKDPEKRWTYEQGVKNLPEPLKKYYQEHPGSLDEFKLMMKMSKEQRKNWEKYRERYALADAWSSAHSTIIHGKSSFPASPDEPPDTWDFKHINPNKLKFKSDKHASELLKKITHSFGATLVGITKVNPDWVYQGYIRGVGKTQFEVPDHWKYAIVFAVPHEWDSMYANPTYGTSYDAYSRLRIIGGKLQAFIRNIGYSSRAHVPPTSYELIMPPLAIDAGLGELGRNSILITPELGANARLAAVTTDIPLQSDKPIKIGIKEFCEKCKICADSCPSGAIEKSDTPQQIVRGYRRWHIDQDKCFRMWNTVATSHPRGCRICLAVCPYSRKNNWIHTIAREVDPRDKTGLFSSLMLGMQKNFFDYPDAEQYLPHPDGDNLTYHNAPDWLLTEEWCNVEKDW